MIILLVSNPWIQSCNSSYLFEYPQRNPAPWILCLEQQLQIVWFRMPHGIHLCWDCWTGFETDRLKIEKEDDVTEDGAGSVHENWGWWSPDSDMLSLTEWSTAHVPFITSECDYESHAYVHHNEFHHTSFNVTCSVHVTIRQRGLKLTHLFHDQWKQQGILTLASMHTQLPHTINNIHSKPWDTPDYDAVIFTTRVIRGESPN